MKSKIIFIVIGIVLVLVCCFGGVNVANNIKGAKQELINNQKGLNKNYEIFVSQVDKFNSKREELNNLSDLYYYEKLHINNNQLRTFFNEYDLIIKDINESANELEKYCMKIDNKKCDTYLVAYETIMTTYRSDIDDYNKLIDEYNNWTKLTKIDKFNSDYIKG